MALNLELLSQNKEERIKVLYSKDALSLSEFDELIDLEKLALDNPLQIFAENTKEQTAEENKAEIFTPETINPTISPIQPLNKNKEFSTIRQGTETNILTKLRATENTGLTIDKITGNATIKKGDFIFTISNYTQLKGLKTSTYQLLDALTTKLTESGAKSPTIVLSLKEYMERRKLKDRKGAINNIISDLEILKRASIAWDNEQDDKKGEKKARRQRQYGFINLADSGFYKNGKITLTLAPTFFNMLLTYPIMPYPEELQRLSSRNNPNSYYLLRKIAEHKNMNIGKKNEDILSVKTLLSVSPYIPAFKEVMSGNRNINDRIIIPFERDMDALHNVLKWEYCNTNNTPLTEKELSNMTYSVFSELKIHITWNNYPDQTARLEKQNREREEAKKKKKATKKNK